MKKPFVSASLEPLSDEELAALVCENNEDAFACLVSRFSSLLQQLSFRYRCETAEPEDLVQEGLLGLQSAAFSYRQDGTVTFRTYAYACVRNRMISARRRLSGEGNDVTPFCEDEPYDLPEEVCDDPARRLLEQEERQLFHDRLRAVLTTEEYRVLILYLASYSYREIAERLSVSVKAVDNALQRMRRKLATQSF